MIYIYIYTSSCFLLVCPSHSKDLQIPVRIPNTSCLFLVTRFGSAPPEELTCPHHQDLPSAVLHPVLPEYLSARHWALAVSRETRVEMWKHGNNQSLLKGSKGNQRVRNEPKFKLNLIVQVPFVIRLLKLWSMPPCFHMRECNPCLALLTRHPKVIN